MQIYKQAGKDSHFSLKNEEGADFPICQVQKRPNDSKKHF